RNKMMKIGKYVVTVFSMGILVAALSGCEKGPAEKAGASIDNAVQKTGQQVDKAGDKIKDTVDDAKK
ncbi:MAG: hypothetical protein ABI265_00075, partial [Gallionella sp.]